MTKAPGTALAVLLPLGAAAALIPPQDVLRPAWVAAPLLILLVRSLAGAFRRAAGTHPRAFPGEEQAFAAPFAIRILCLVSAPGARELCGAAALWAAFGAAAYAAEAALGPRGRRSPAVFAAALGILSGTAALIGIPAGLAGAVLAAALLSYAARRRIPL